MCCRRCRWASVGVVSGPSPPDIFNNNTLPKTKAHPCQHKHKFSVFTLNSCMFWWPPDVFPVDLGVLQECANKNVSVLRRWCCWRVPSLPPHPRISRILGYQITLTSDALLNIFQDESRSYFSVSGLRRCRVFIKIQMPRIDCVIRLVQPGPGVLIGPVIYDHFQEKSFCVII